MVAPLHVTVQPGVAPARSAHQVAGTCAVLTYDPRMPRATYEIPDPAHLFPATQVGPIGPTGPLIAFEPDPLDVSQVLHRTIDEWIPCAGTYGMGGPGYLGFRLGSDWLIVAIWGAGDWFRLDGRLLSDVMWEQEARPAPWEAEPSEVFAGLFAGHSFTDLVVRRDSLTARLDSGRIFSLSADPADRPILAGSGEPRSFGPGDDLRDLVFLAPTSEIWV